MPYYEDRSRPVANRLRPKPVKTGLVTAKDRKRPVCSGSVRFFAVSGIGRTGYGYGLRHWAPKDRTGPDFQTLHPGMPDIDDEVMERPIPIPKRTKVQIAADNVVAAEKKATKAEEVRLNNEKKALLVA